MDSYWQCAHDRGQAVSSLGSQRLFSGTDHSAGYSLVRIILGSLFLTAATLKGYQLAIEPTIEANPLGSRLYLIGVVEFELFFGIWLLAGIFPRETWFVTLAVFFLLMCVSVYTAVSGYVSCGCFGKISINPWYTAMLDLAILISLLCWRPKKQLFTSFRKVTAKSACVCTVWLLIGLPVAFVIGGFRENDFSHLATNVRDGKIVVLEPAKWIGKKFPLVDYLDIGDQLGTGRWLVLLYHDDCPDCKAVLPKYVQLSKELTARNDSLRIAFIQVPQYRQQATNSLTSFFHDSNCVRGHLDSSVDWFVQTPCVVGINDGFITTVSEKRFVDAVP